MSVFPSPLKSPTPTIVQGLEAEPGEPPPITLAPSISQITTCPVMLLYQMMSALPSLLTSPAPATDQGLISPPGTEPGEPPPITVEPFISQITTCPVSTLSQRI